MTLYKAVHAVDSNGDGTLTALTRPCGFCGEWGEVIVPENGFYSWASDRVPIQDAMPDVPKEQREQLVSGTCPDCWKEYFGLPVGKGEAA